MAVCELGTFFRARCQTTASRCAGDFRCHSANQGHCKRYRCAFSKSLSYETLEDMTDKLDIQCTKYEAILKFNSLKPFGVSFWCPVCFFHPMKGFIGEDLRLRIAGRLAMGLQALWRRNGLIGRCGFCGKRQNEKMGRKWRNHRKSPWTNSKFSWNWNEKKAFLVGSDQKDFPHGDKTGRLPVTCVVFFKLGQVHNESAISFVPPGAPHQIQS